MFTLCVDRKKSNLRSVFCLDFTTLLVIKNQQYRVVPSSFELVFLSPHFNGRFPCGFGLAGTRMYPFRMLLDLKMIK